jgi:thiamine biosynthesis lipoprotein
VHRHHLLDPRSGEPIDSGLDAVTVIARDAWIAEVLSKAAFVAGAAGTVELVPVLGGAALLVEGPDRVSTTAGFTAFVGDVLPPPSPSGPATRHAVAVA